MAKAAPAKKVTVKSQSKTLFDKFEAWGAKNDTKLFYAFLILSLLFSVLLFNARISEAHDDALYLEGGSRYVNEFPTYFYTQNAPLYVMFLGLMIKLFGFKLLLFKFANVVFNFFAVFFFYRTFRNRIPYSVLVPVMIFISCNHLIQYFASMTFTEAFYLFLQSLFFLYFFKLYNALETDPNPNKHIKLWTILGLFTFLISTTKSVAIVGVPALVIYFALQKQWKYIFYSVGSFTIFKGFYEIIVRAVWGAQNQFSGQGAILLLKDPYNKSAGNEDLGGFISRFFDNTQMYLGKRFFELLGFIDEIKEQQTQEQIDSASTTHSFLAFVIFALVFWALFKVYKQNNRPLLFYGLFTVGQFMLSFIILQTRWDQPRIILICMPVMLILIFYLFYNAVKKSGMGQNIYWMVIITISVSVLIASLRRGSDNLPIVKRNLAGDKYFGYTPDWQNFLKCSEWCADSLPANTLVASRKAPMSFVYGKGKKFFPIYSVLKKDTATDQSHPDSALAFFKSKGVTHVMLGSLRINPTQNTGQVINTVHNIMQPIMQKYPDKVKLVHTEGFAEETYVFEIIY